MIRKRFVLFFGLLIFMLFVVSAASEGDPVDRLGLAIGKVITSGFSYVLEGVSEISISAINVDIQNIFYFYYLFLLFLIIYAITDTMDFFGSKIVKVVVALLITGLSSLALPQGFIQILFPAQFASTATILTVLFLSMFLFLVTRMSSLFAAYIISTLATATALAHFFARVYEAQTLVAIHLFIISILLLVVTICLPWIRRRTRSAEIDEEGQNVGRGFGLLQTLMDSTGKLAGKLSAAREESN